jgi:hypothetical protein
MPNVCERRINCDIRDDSPFSMFLSHLWEHVLWEGFHVQRLRTLQMISADLFVTIRLKIEFDLVFNTRSRKYRECLCSTV